MASETAILGWATVGDMVLGTGYNATQPAISFACPGTRTLSMSCHGIRSLTISCPGVREITLS